MPNFISEDDIEQAMVQRLQHLYGYDVLDCLTSDPAKDSLMHVTRPDPTTRKRLTGGQKDLQVLNRSKRPSGR